MNWYGIKIDGYSESVSSRNTEYTWPRHLEPGRNYSVEIVVYCWWFSSYRKRSTYNGYIQTQRKCNTFCIMHCLIILNQLCKKKFQLVTETIIWFPRWFNGMAIFGGNLLFKKNNTHHSTYIYVNFYIYAYTICLHLI